MYLCNRGAFFVKEEATIKQQIAVCDVWLTYLIFVFRYNLRNNKIPCNVPIDSVHDNHWRNSNGK